MGVRSPDSRDRDIATTGIGRRRFLHGGLAVGAAAALSSLAAVNAPSAGAISSAELMQSRIAGAASVGARRGVQTGIAYLDRRDGTILGSAGAHEVHQSASVAKVFIADEFLRAKGPEGPELADQRRLAAMLRNSDNDAANNFWRRLGGVEVVEQVVDRYRLTETVAESYAWGATGITAHDMVRFYDGLLSGSGGSTTATRDRILFEMRRYNPEIQPWGLVRGIDLEPVKAIKGGWTPIRSGEYIMHSTGILGSDQRFVCAILTTGPSQTVTRAAITQMTRTLFPEGTPQGYSAD